MPEINWTEAQLEAIESRGNNVLVSAAAGSGKTTVLVERVIRMITRDEEPVDIDRLLIMTFTRAAASQMRGKIFKGIRDKLGKCPENEHLRKQLLKVHNAKICTIDALCSDIVRENFHCVDIDPGFRIADEAEMGMLMDETLKEVLEEHYAEPTDEFLDFVNYYTDKNDSKIDSIILTLHKFAQSHPEPKGWLKAGIFPYKNAGQLFSKEGDPDNPNNWMESFAALMQDEITEIRSMAETGLSIAETNCGPAAYEDYFRETLDFLESLDGQCFDYRKEAIENYIDSYKQSPRIKCAKDSLEETLKDIAKDLRAKIKKKLESIRDGIMFQNFEGMCNDMAECLPVAQTLVNLTLEFEEKLFRKEKEKSIADFSDIAHFALKILINYDENGKIIKDGDGNISYTETADRMSGSFDEIIVDEYQDTNRLQEYLINAISGERFGKPDVFMVGDVKQSIYGFRMACPELFQEKYNNYIAGKGGRLIILDRNYRSRKQVIDLTNTLFEKTMVSETGGIDYTNGHALSYGKTYPEETREEKEQYKYRPEIIFIQGSGEQAKRLESYRIAERIEKLISEGYEFKDIAILTRDSKNAQLEKTLTERGIPLVKASNSGFFESFEVSLVLDLLNIIDNPYQDIPFAAVLRSPICSADVNDLAKIRLAGGEGQYLFDCTKAYGGFGWFMDKLEDYRKRASYMGICDLLDYVLDDIGMYNILLAMPQGKLRKANVDMLKSKAETFARGTYSGLFNFIKYIRELKKNEVDFGQADLFGADANAVQMMTVHKSKGLEFKVVILAHAGKKYNEMDLRSNVVLDSELGVGIEYRNPETRLVRNTLFMESIKHKKKTDLFAEEMRLLYVALTRAKEKLIITGTDKDLKSMKEGNWALEEMNDNCSLEPFKILSSGSYLKIMGLALYKERNNSELFDLQILTSEDIETERVIELAENSLHHENIMERVSEGIDISDFERRMNYVYPFVNATLVQGKITASQLEKKNDHVKAGGESEEPDKDCEEMERFIHKFRKRKGLTGAERGNAYHKFFELMDYAELNRERAAGKLILNIKKQLNCLTGSGYMTEDQMKAVNAEKIRQFIESDTGKKMMNAALAGKLHREQQFVMGTLTDINSESTLTRPEKNLKEKGDYSISADFGETNTIIKANEISENIISGEEYVKDEEYLLVQGIIDAYIEYEDHLELIDYKTDRNTDETYYMETYGPQQNEYARALEAVYGKPVRAKILYSLELGREIYLI